MMVVMTLLQEVRLKFHDSIEIEGVAPEHLGQRNAAALGPVQLGVGIDAADARLDLGARGIKLHPRSQGFLLNDERLAPVFALAAERRVPILIHGGRGLPPISDHLERLVDAYPQAHLIIAHGGIAFAGIKDVSFRQVKRAMQFSDRLFAEGVAGVRRIADKGAPTLDRSRV